MWPFRSRKPADDEQSLASRVMQLELDFERLYDNVLRTLRRLNKRDQDAARRRTPEEEEAVQADGGGIPPDLDPISRQIWLRRKRHEDYARHVQREG